jgi:O-antigen/teichoic acid export membrane protein
MNTRQDHVTGPAFLLVGGRTVGLIATFAIGPIFARVFSLDDVGTFKAFFLLYATLYGLAQLGMAESLYYFLPRDAGNIGRYVCNAALTLLVAGIGCIALLWAARTSIAEFGGAALADAIVPLGLFLTFMLVGTVLEIMMVSRKQHMTAAVTYAASDVVRTALFILPALLFGNLYLVFIGATIFAALRMTMMLGLIWREFRHQFRPDLSLWRSQMAYALPFALAVGVEVILITYHQYVVGGRFDKETFAIYMIGCMSIPLMDLIVTSTTSVMMVKMGEMARHRDQALAVFHDAVSRLAFLLCPLTVALVVLAQPFIITLFTAKFAASVPIFMVWALTIVPMVFAVDAVLRVYAQTRFLLVMNAVRFAVVVGCIGWFIDSFGLVGAVLATLTALTAAKAAGLLRIASVLHVSVAQVLPWWTLARITARALAAAVPAWWLSYVFAGIPWLALAAGGAVYGITYLVLCYAPGIAEPAAIRLPIVARLRRYAGSAARNPAYTEAGSEGRIPQSGPAETAPRHPAHTEPGSVGRVPQSGPAETGA